MLKKGSKVIVSVSLDEPLYEKLRELASERGYRSFSKFINDALRDWLEGELSTNQLTNQLTNQPTNLLTNLPTNQPTNPEPNSSNRIPDPPCKSCEYLRGSICAKYDKPITRCMECPEMRKYVSRHFSPG